MTEEAQFDELRDLDAFAATMAAIGAAVPIGPIAQACPGLMKALLAVHPVKAAATVGGLLTQKRLQPNCLRLEALVHLCVAAGNGKHAPTSQLLIQGYTTVGSACGFIEDPPEDIFVGNIYSKRGNYRVLEGLWESGTFYLQRFVNLCDNLPDKANFRMIADSVHALLKVSDIVCARAGLTRNELGHPNGELSLPRKLAEKSSPLRQMVQFGFGELEQLGIDLDDLAPFIFNPQNRKTLLEQSITNSELEACPLGVDGDQLYLLLPTAVSAAVRRFFISILGTGDNRRVLLSSLGREYTRLFDESSMLGGRAPTMPFSHLSWGSVCCVSIEVDKGRYLCLVLFMDTLEDFTPLGFAGMYVGNERFCEEVQRVVTEAQNAAMQRSGFQDGITLLIGCGVGRGAAFPIPVEAREQWKTEILSAPDYCTLSRTKDMTPLNL